jgi:hypothetical protein
MAESLKNGRKNPAVSKLHACHAERDTNIRCIPAGFDRQIRMPCLPIA